MSRNKTPDRDTPAALPAVAALPQGSLGAWLRTQREARGVSLREIADSSKISLRYLEALELDRFDVLPAPVFVRGFLKEYARVVGLDADEVVNLYLLSVDDTTPELPPVDTRSPRDPSGPSPFGYGLVLVLAVVLFLAIAAGLSWWAKRRVREAPPPAPAGVAVVTEPAAARAPAESPGPPPAPTPGAVLGAPTEVRSAATPEPGPLRVVLEFSEDCWVETVIDGKRRTSELRASGEVLTLEANESVLLTLGNAAGVRIEVDGRPFLLPGGGTRVVHDLRIDRESVERSAGPGSTPP